jgi:type IX secretion system PorP/SprF family membrane protein
MKKIIITIIAFITLINLNAQQVPISENYFMDKASISPSYAGHFNPGTLYTSFRSDWSGIEGGPKSLKLSYSDKIMDNAAYGARILSDNAGIFRQLYIMGTYSYKVVFASEHTVLMGLSAGLYHNKINFTEYYNDPNYNYDPVLVQEDISSKLKFMSDFSVAYLFKGIEAGILVSNINFGDMKYAEATTSYKPFANYQIHAAYTYAINEQWTVNPLMFWRDGTYIKGQFGLAARGIYQDRLWASLSFRDPSIFGIGIGAELIKGLNMSYNFNFASSVKLNAFNNHEIALGFDIREFINIIKN